MRATRTGWSAPTFMTMTGGSIGLQIGGQATDLVLVIMNRRGLEQFVRNQFKFGADASRRSRTGRARRAGKHRPSAARRDPQLLTRERPVRRRDSINGSTVRADLDANQRFYGKRIDRAQLVLDKTIVESSTPVPEWIQTLSRHITR